MNNIYEKIKEADPQKRLIWFWIAGVIAGILCWVALRAGSFSEDGLLQWVFVIVFAVIMLGSNKLAKETGVSFAKFRLAMVVGLGSCIVIFVASVLLTGGFNKGTGLLELVFNVQGKGFLTK